MSLVLVSFLGVFGLVISLGLLLVYRDEMLDRLSRLTGRRTERGARLRRLLGSNPSTRLQEVIKPFEKVLPKSPQEVSVIQKRLIRAGYRESSAVNVFYGAKVLVPLLMAALVTVTAAYEIGAFFAYSLALGLGFLAPDFWLGNRIKARQFKIRLGLPEALDLLVICTEAGMGLDQAVSKVAVELKDTQPQIADELGLVNLEQKAGKPRDESLKNFAERTDLDCVRALTNTLIQADTFGTSIAKTLRVYSDTLRTQRRQHAEEQAAKTTVKLVFPLVFFIFPSLFVVALGPAVIAVLDGFKKYF